MAKANEKDMDAALEMCRALEALENEYLPAEMTPDDDCVAYYADEHAEKVVDYLVAINKRASLFRVCFGMTVLLDPQNEIVDPEASTLEAHPKFSRIEDQRDELLEALKESRRELHACQAVIHLAGGFDPAYVSGAQESIKRTDAIIAKSEEAA